MTSKPQIITLPDIANLPDDALLTRKQCAALSGYADYTFKKWARQGRGPNITRLEGRPRYRAADVRAWFSSASMGSEQQSLTAYAN